MNLAWPEKAALALLVIVTMPILFFGLTAPRLLPSNEWMNDFLLIEGRVFWVVILPLWLALRALDFIFGGPARRRAARIVRLPGW